MRLLLLIFALILTTAQATIAASKKESYYANRLSVGDGLPSNTIRAMVQDNDGYIWFGGTGGLARYDGYDVVQINDIHDGMPVNNIGLLEMDRHNSLLWVTTATYNIKCLELRKGTFADYTGKGDADRVYRKHLLTDRGMWLYTEQYGIRHITYDGESFKCRDYTAADKSMPENSITYMSEDGQGNVWAITQHTINYIDTAGNSRMIQGSIRTLDLRAREHDIVVLDKTNKAWIYSSNGRLRMTSQLPIALGRVDKVTTSVIWKGKYYVFTTADTYACDITTGRWERAAIQVPGALDQGKADGYQFIANTTDGTLWLLPDEGKATPLHLIDRISANPGRGRIFNIAKQDDSTLLIATYGAGLIIYDTTTGHTTRFSSHDESPLFHSDYLFDILADLSGGIWVASVATGVTWLGHRQPSIARYVKPIPNKNNDRDNGISRIFKLRDGDIAVTAFDFRTLVLDTINGTLSQLPSPYGDIIAYTTDQHGHEWMITKSGGLMSDGKQITKTTTIGGVLPTYINDMVVDSSGRLWMATWKGGLLWTRPDTKGTQFHSLLTDNFNQSRIYDIELTPDGWLWAATCDGLYAINTRKKQPGKDDILTFNTKNGSLPANEIICIMAGNDSTLWIGTQGYGILRATLHEGRHKLSYLSLTKQNGLANNNIRSIMAGKGNDIWIGTEEGLAVVNSSTMLVRNIMPAASIMGNVFNDNSGLCLANGTIFFGTDDGVAIVDARRMQTTGQLTQQPHITDVHIDGSSIYGTPALRHYISDITAGHLTLESDKNDIKIYFSSLDYLTAGETLYQYYLEGYDETWREPTSANTAEYLHLQPGTYTFHVKASNGAQWSDMRTLVVVIRQPWYSTPLAWLFYIMLITAFSAIVYRQWRRNFELKQSMAIDRQLTDFRISFFTSIAHEFRTPLAIIDGAVNRLTSPTAAERPTSQRPALQQIRRGTKRLLRLVNELMEFRKINTGNIRLTLQNCDIVKLVRDVFNDLRPLAQQKEQNITFIPFAKSFVAPIDSNKLESIVYNLLSNAVKYTPDKGNITLRITHQDNMLAIIVEDSGPGISLDQQACLFEPFMHGNVSKGGMGIGLYTAKRMAQAHHGDISYEEAGQDKGAQFTLTLPDRAAAYTAEELDSLSHTNTDKRTDSTNYTVVREPMAEPLNNETIAIIEDDRDMLEQLTDELGIYFKTVTYTNGADGYQGVIASKPSLVICDVMLPDMDGYSIVGNIRKDKSLDNMPVIMLTALDDVGHQIKGYKAGADDYMVKPCNYQLLTTRAAQLITWAKNRQQAQSLSDNSKEAPVVTSMADKNFRKDIDRHIAQHLNDPDFNIERLAALMQMGHTKFYGKMRDITGMSPNKYIMSERMRIAGELVLEGRMNVSEIAYKVGFQDPSYFNKCFKRHFGTVPTKYGKGDKQT